MTFSDSEGSSTVQQKRIINGNKHLDHTYHYEEYVASTIRTDIETRNKDIWNYGRENQIKSMWKMILIILVVLIALASFYLGRCVHRQLTSKCLQIKHTSTPSTTLNETNQIESYYERVQDVEYSSSQRYLSAVCDTDNPEADNLHFQETIGIKRKPVIIGEMKEVSTNENQLHSGESEMEDMYINPCT